MNLLEFCQQNSISYRDLSDIAGGTAKGASKSTIENFLKGRLDKAKETELRKVLAKNLPDYLLFSGMNPLEINENLSRIFTEGEFTEMVTQRVQLTPTAQNWFGLSADPFGINLSGLGDVFISPQLQEIHDSIIEAIKFQGFVSIVGDIGSGKTVLRSWVEETVANDDRLELIFPENFDMAKITPSSIARAILEHFDYGRIPIDGGSKTRAVKKLLAERTKSTRIAIAFDECHRLNLTTLSSLKNFLEMNSGGFRRYLGVILLGQPSFQTHLTKSREIAERLHTIEMPNFQHSAIDYLSHRLSLVGGDLEELFDEDARTIIAKNASTPLQLGNIANKAMLTVMDPNTYGQKKVIGSIINSAMNLPTKLKKKLQAVG